MRLNERASSSFPLMILFGMVLAVVTGVIFALFYERQLEARVADQAQDLADDLSATAFSCMAGGQPSLNLPSHVGGSTYRISILDNNTFVVTIVSGRLKGRDFSSIANFPLKLRDANFIPGGKVYFQREGESAIVSASPIEISPKRMDGRPSGEPPEFYHFAKRNQREATAIIAAYFFAGRDIHAYRWQDKHAMLLELDDGRLLRVVGRETEENVGSVSGAWVVELVEVLTGELTESTACPSVENAHSAGWLYSPSEALTTLRSRSWRRMSDNVALSIPNTAVVKAAAASTKVGTFAAYRIAFENYVIFYRAMPTWWDENAPGFIFQSEPKLEVLS